MTTPTNAVEEAVKSFQETFPNVLLDLGNAGDTRDWDDMCLFLRTKLEEMYQRGRSDAVEYIKENSVSPVHPASQWYVTPETLEEARNPTT